jgi:thymidylate synthase (FAD)
MRGFKLEGIKVELLDFCGSDEAVANAARVSFSAFGEWNGIPEGYTKAKADKLIEYLAEHQHTSPFRHNSITVRCQAPIFLARQLMKHQAGLSWNEISMRYCDKPVGFFIPEEWRSRPDKSLKQGSGNGVVEILSENDEYYAIELKEFYQNHLNNCVTLYERLLDNNVAPEMARIVLPQSMLTDWVWTGNLMAFSHVYNLRSKDNAQLEARVFAEQLNSVIEPLFPVSWKALTEQQ